jgi:hypothetical protein
MTDKRYDYRKIKEAMAALDRAADAAWRAEQYPHSRSGPCRDQMKVANDEISCAKALLKKAEIND